MKQGKTLTELATELDRQVNTKRDFVADSRKLYMDPTTNNMELTLNDDMFESFETNKIAHGQISSKLQIPTAYYNRMPEDLRAVNVNHWLRNNPTKHLLRVLDGKCRAFMSDRYRTLDNFDLAQVALPILGEVEDMEIVSCELTEMRMYIKALFPKIEGEVEVGDTVQSGIVISNSEVGMGSLRVEDLIYRLACKNGMILPYSQKKYHIGRGQGSEDHASEIFRDETKEADDRAFWMKIQDTIRAALSQEHFDNGLKEMRRTQGMVIEDDPVQVVERVQKKFALSDDERGGVLTHLIQGGNLTGYGLLNALTRTAQDVDDYDRATDMERMGGKIIELSQRDWKELAVAA